MSSQVRECVCFWLTQFTLCKFCPNQLEMNNSSVSCAVCLVQVAFGTSSACCRCAFPCCQLFLCTRLCVHDSRHAAHNGSRTPHMSISSHRKKKKEASKGTLREGSKKHFFKGNVTRNRAAIEVRKMKNHQKHRKNLYPGPQKLHSALQASYLFLGWLSFSHLARS